MKIGGVKVTPPSQKFLVLEREGADLVFIAQAVEDFDEFNALCAEPTPPRKMVKGVWKVDESDTSFREVCNEYANRQMAYLFVKTLEPSNIEWDKVDMSKPSTWTNWSTELREAGLTNVEIGYVRNLVWEANALDEEKLKQARDSFVLGRQREQSEPSSQNTEQPSS